MKNFLFIILFTYPLFGFSQSPKKNFFDGGIVLGLNATQVDGDNLSGYNKLMLNGGAYGGFPIEKTRSLYFLFELLYSGKGSQSTINEEPQGQNYILSLHYADVPFYLQYRDKDNKFRFGLGLGYSRLFAAYEEIDFLATPDAINYYNKSDFYWLADAQYMLTNHIGFDFRFNWSIRYIRNFGGYMYNGVSLINPNFGENQYNRYLTFRFFYSF
jgi:Outer membrane protein beta-barrel domain